MSDGISFFAAGSGGYSHPYQPVRHSYPLAVRDAGLATAASLVARTLPYALARLGLLLAFALGTILWAGITFGGAAWLEARVAGPIAAVWLVGGLAAFGLAVWLRNVIGTRRVGRLWRTPGASTASGARPVQEGRPDARDPPQRPHHPGGPCRDRP